VQVGRIASKKVILPADLDRMRRLLVIARRCCNGPHLLGKEVRDQEVPKLEELEHALRDLCLGEGRKAIVFSEWTDMTDRVELLCDRLRLPSVHLHGGVPVARRPGLIRSFTEKQGPAVFISTDAGGVGLNLQAADVVVNLDLPWNPARLEQRIARAHRIGSKKTVQVLLLVTRESVEERILQLHETKRNVLENIWSKDGEDTIAAPGGSGAFRDMVLALLASRGPHRGDDPEQDRTARPTLAGEARASEMGGRADAAAPEPPTPELGLEPRGGELLESDRADDARAAPTGVAHAASKVDGESGRTTATGGAAAPAARVPDAGSEAAMAAPGIDPGVLAAAIAGVAPALPPGHRKSLATVLRALAEALDA
jgi:superfamily II DNA/RNA helicase